MCLTSLDPYVKELLFQWQLEHLCPIFEKHAVTFFSLRHSKEEDFKELIPQVGARIAFLYHWKDWKSGIELLDLSQAPKQVTAGGEDLSSGNIILDFPEFSVARSSNDSTIDSTDCVSNNRDNSVCVILKKTPEGCALLSNGLSKGILISAERRKLCSLVIGDYLKDDPGKLIERRLFLQWSHDIGSIFKDENPLVYYTSYVKAEGYREKRNAGGKLYECYLSKRRSLRKLGVLTTSRSRSASRSSAGTPSQEEVEVVINSSILEERLKWLESSAEPFHLILEYWEETFPLRKKDLLKPAGAVGDILKKYPALSLPTGYTLLHSDFDKLYPEKSNCLFSNVILLRDKIIKSAREKSNAKDVKESIKDILLQLQDECDSTYSVTASLVALLTLPFTVPLSTRKKSWRPSRTEVLEGFVHRVPTENLVTEAIRLRQQKLERLKVSFQPWIVYVGSDLGSVTSAFVIVEGIFEQFKVQIEEFNELYCNLTKETLKPKFHFLTHYPQMMLKFGPLSLVWTMRFEARHRLSKYTASLSCNRKNICKTIALKNQLILNDLLLDNSVPRTFTSGLGKEVRISTVKEITSQLNIDSSNISFREVKWLKINGNCIRLKTNLTFDICEVTLLPIFVDVENIVTFGESGIALLCAFYDTLDFNEHFFAYQIRRTDRVRWLRFEAIMRHVPNNITIMSNMDIYVTLRCPID